MIVTVHEPNPAHKELIKNLYVFFRYDLMPYVESGPIQSVNSHGVIALDGDNSRTHSEAVASCDDFWAEDKRGILFPMLIELDGKPAGFALVATKPYVHPTVDYRLYDFYILNIYRRRGVAREAAFRIFDRFPGIWEITWLPRNLAAAKCWPALADEYTGGAYEDWPVDEGMDGLKFVSLGHREETPT